MLISRLGTAVLTATVVALAGATVGAVGSAAPPGTLDRPLTGYRIDANAHADGGWIGSRRIERGVTVFRVDPLASNASSAFGRARPVRRLSRGGTRVPANVTARAAWILSTYGTFRVAAQAAAVDAAVHHLLVGGRWRIQQPRGAARIAQTGLPHYVRSFVAEMLRDSARLAGPYRTVLRASPATEDDRSEVTLEVESAAGNPIVGRDVIFRYGDQLVRTETGPTGVAGASFAVGAAGQTPVTAVVSQLPEWRLLVRSPRRAKASRVVVAGRRIRKQVRTEVDVAGVQVLTLANARADYTTRQAIGGRWTLDGHGGDRIATFGLFGPFPTAAAASCAANLKASTTRTVDEDGEFDLPGAPVPTVGYYRYGVTVSANETNQVASVCGAPFRVRAVPTVTVSPGRTPIQAGQDVFGKLTVTGLQARRRLTSTVRLYGPFPSAAAASCATGKLYRTRTVPVSDDGTVATSAVKPFAQGGKVTWYVWTAALAQGEFSTFAASTCRATGSFLRVFPS